MRNRRQTSRRRPHEPVRALADPVGGPVHPRRHRAGTGLPRPLPVPRAAGGGPGESAGGGAHLDHDHPHADEDRLRRPAPGQGPLEGHRRHPGHQLGGQALLHGPAGLVVHPPGLRPLAAGGAARQLCGGADPAGRGALHRHGLRLEPPVRWRSLLHPVPGGAQRHHHGLRLRAHRRVVVGAVRHRRALGHPADLSGALHRHSGGHRPSLAPFLTETGSGPVRRHPRHPGPCLHPRPAGHPDPALRLPG